VITLADDCPYCRILADRMRSTADDLSSFAGGVIGGRIGGVRGRLIGQEVAPEIIERGALAIAGAVKRKRKQSRNQKRNGSNLSKALKQVNAKARNKNGSMRKGWTQVRIMQAAHKIARKMR
jgi:outer membrane lipoprotein SlyB